MEGEMFMKFKRLLASVTAAALAITTMAVTSFTASAADVDVTSNSQFMLKLTSSGGDGGATNYDGNYAGNGTATSLTFSGANVSSNSDTTNTSLQFSYAVGALDETNLEIGDVLNVSITGLTITAKKSTDTEVLVNNQDIEWTQTKENGWWSGDKSLSLSTISFDNLGDFKVNGSIEATWTGLTVTMAGENTDNPTVPEGTKVTLIENAPYNWQVTNSVTVSGITNWTTTAAEAKEKLDSVKVTFTVNGALSDGASFDVTKLGFEGVIQTNDAAGGLWKTYPATVTGSTVTINMTDIGTALSDKTGAVNIAFNISTATENATKPVDVYISEVTVEVKAPEGGGSEEPDDPNPPAGDTTGSYTGSIGEGDAQPSLPITITPGSGKTLADIRSITVTVTLSEGSWGGGCLGMNVDGTWTSTNWSNDGAMTVTIQTPNGAPEDGSCQFQIWWLGNGSGDATVSYSVSYTYSDGSSSGNTPGGDTPGGDTPITPPVVSGNSVTMGSTSFNGWFEAVLTKDQLFGSNTGATTITFTGADLAKVGYNSISAGGYKGIDCTGTVTIQVNDIDLSDNFFLHVGGNAATVVTWSFNGGSSGGNEPSNPTDPSNPSAPSYGSTYEPPIPSGATSISMVDTIISTGAASVSFNLGSSAKLDKEVFEALASKGDITVRFNVAGGAYWEIGGANITSAKAVDLGVRMNSTLIPASAVSELAGDKTTIQLSLKHNGDFGFTGVLNVPVGKANNGKFANLYYYHSGKFDFVGSSAISDGRAKFAFSHASNYLIVIDDYAYGEDVSSAAGMTETTETSAVPYVAALVVVSAFAASAVVLKKRLSK